jgi:hypothetical protein
LRVNLGVTLFGAPMTLDELTVNFSHLDRKKLLSDFVSRPNWAPPIIYKSMNSRA